MAKLIRQGLSVPFANKSVKPKQAQVSRPASRTYFNTGHGSDAAFLEDNQDNLLLALHAQRNIYGLAFRFKWRSLSLLEDKSRSVKR